MKIADEGHYVDTETGRAIDEFALANAEFERVALDRPKENILECRFEDANGEVDSIEFKITNKRYIGIEPCGDRERRDIADDLLDVLLEAGYAAVTPIQKVGFDGK